MVKITIYIEGGGDTRRQQASCRRGFSDFFEKLNIKANIVACGGRQFAYDNFCIKLKKLNSNEHCLLLVDSEAPVATTTKWQHVFLRQGDGWKKPNNATEEHLHFMTECMESWFMADKQALATYYGKNFNKNALSKNTNIENISKQDLYDTLKKATRNTTKGSYSKGEHSFEILRKIDAKRVVICSPSAKKLEKRLNELLNPKTSTS
jgi:hypothetical protein